MRKIFQQLCQLVLPGLLLMSQLSLAADGRGPYLYRYVDEAGITVINSSISPEYVKRGYEILKMDGSLVKVVPRSLTPEERALAAIDAREKDKEEIEAKRLAKWDKSLMLRYSTIEDIEAARDRALSELRIRISIMRSNVRALTLQVESHQSRAADVERRGGIVPVEMVAAIGTLRREIKATERSIEERVEETEVVARGFKRDIERFAVILEELQLLRKQVSKTRD
jgi:hypothetical protein